MFDFDGYLVFTNKTKMAEVASAENLRAKLGTLPMIVTYEQWIGSVLRCDVTRMTDTAEFTVDIDSVGGELRCSSRQRGAIESLLDDMGELVGERGHVEETRIRLLKRR